MMIQSYDDSSEVKVYNNIKEKDAKEFLRKINSDFVNHYQKIDDSKEFYEYLNKPIKTSIRINTLKIDLETFKNNFSEKYDLIEIPWCKEGFFVNSNDVGKTLEHALGYFFIQEAASMIPVVVLEPKPGEKVLDIAAAPGAKATQIAMYMRNEGYLVANDIRKDRIYILISNLQRMGVTIAKVSLMDGRKFIKYENKFDKVLLDAPCSNVGMIRKNYKHLKMWSYRMVKRCSKLQKELILAAYKTLKTDGILVYSTCTIDPEENEEVVDFLLRNTNAELEDIKLKIRRRKPILKYKDKEYDSSIKKCLRIHPQDNDTEAFFVAKIIKHD